MRTTHLLVLLVALSGLAFALQTPAPQVKPAKKPAPYQSVNRQAKLQAVKTKFPKLAMTGLMNSATLTTRNHYIANTAWMVMLKPRATFPNFDTTEFLAQNSTGLGHGASVYFNVKRPNKAHLITFYFDAASLGTMYASNDMQDVMEISDSQRVMAGARTMLIAFIPTATGEYHFRLNSSEIDFVFKKVEVDVVD